MPPLILGTEALKDDKHIDLKEAVLLKHNLWNGQRILDLDNSWKTIIVMVKRNGVVVVARNERILLEGDHLIMHSQERIANASTIQI